MKQVLLRVSARFIPNLYRPPAGVLLPYGHIVSDAPPPHVRHLFEVPRIARFESHLDFLIRHYRPIGIAELERLPRSPDRTSSPSSFILSFDDGMREVYDVVAPILRRTGVPAVFFLNSAMIDNRQLMWRHKVSLLIERSSQHPDRVPPQLGVRPGERWQAKVRALRFGDARILDDIARFLEVDFDDYLRRAKPYLTTDQVLDLARQGFEIGSHSETHPYFSELAVEDQERQIFASVESLRALGLPCRYFAFPFNDHGVPASIFRYMRDLDIVLSFGTSEARLDSVPYSFQRFAIDANHADSSFPGVLRELSAKSLVRRLSGTEVIRRN